MEAETIGPTQTDVVTLGEVLGVMIALDGPVDRATRFDRSIAGAEANVAVGLARLGHRVTWIGHTGDDMFGRYARATLIGEGVTTIGRVDPSRPTGLIVRDHEVSRPVTVWYRRDGSAASALGPADISDGLIESSRILHLTGLTAMLSPSAEETVFAAIERARRAGVTITLDPNVRLRLAEASRWIPLLRRLAPLCDVMLIGEDEFAFLGGWSSPESLLDQGVGSVVVKRGGAGATEFDRSGRHDLPAPAVALVDPVGAGDGFAAGWISAWLDGGISPERLARGVAIGAQVVAHRGDLVGLPTRAELAGLGGVDVLR